MSEHSAEKDAAVEGVIEYLRSDEAERALTDSMSDHVYGHARSNNPHYFGCNGRCASRAALDAVARQIADRVTSPGEGREQVTPDA